MLDSFTAHREARKLRKAEAYLTEALYDVAQVSLTPNALFVTEWGETNIGLRVQVYYPDGLRVGFVVPPSVLDNWDLLYWHVSDALRNASKDRPKRCQCIRCRVGGHFGVCTADWNGA